MPASSEEIREGLSILFENFWIIRKPIRRLPSAFAYRNNDLKTRHPRETSIALEFIKPGKNPFRVPGLDGHHSFQ